MKTYSRVYAKIDLDAIAYNMEQMKNRIGQLYAIASRLIRAHTLLYCFIIYLHSFAFFIASAIP